jgi:MerR family transcriptional regulator, light-induced transcriptional regulator
MLKTAGGHRRIALEELLRFVAHSERPLLNPMAIGLSLPPRQNGDSHFVAGATDLDLFRNALACGDEISAKAVLDSVFRQCGSAAQASEQLITQAMHRFGEAWNRSEIDVYQERRATGICLRLIHYLRMKMPESSGPIAIGGSPEGDPYQLPTSLVELALREAGWSAHSLGADLPLTSIRRAIDDYQPRVVWLSVSSVSSPETFIDRFNELADSMPENCALLVGGRALDDTFRPKLKYTAHCDSLRQLVALADVMRRRTFDVKQSSN